MDASVVITGGCGFLGAALADHIHANGVNLPDGTALDQPDLILLDRAGAVDPQVPGADFVPFDITDPDALRAAIPANTRLVYHLAAIVSGQAEADFALGLAVNVDGTRALLDVLRDTCPGVVVIGTSSLAVYGPDAQTPLTEATATHPTNTYGMTKAMGELLFADMRRRGWLDARILRLPTITVRPGAPNAAASSFVSSIIREPLKGVPAICPVDPSLALWVASPAAAIASLHHAPHVAMADWPAFGAVNVPGLTVTVADMCAALRAYSDTAAGLVSFQHDPAIAAIVENWPAEFDCALASGLGFAGDTGFGDILTQAIRQAAS